MMKRILSGILLVAALLMLPLFARADVIDEPEIFVQNPDSAALLIGIIVVVLVAVSALLLLIFNKRKKGKNK